MKYSLVSFFLFLRIAFYSQAHTHDLIYCTGTDGINWNNNSLFEANAGVPSLTQHSSGVIYCAFQWFPPPNTPTNTAFDKVAIKQSSDGGLTWSAAQTVNFIGFPPTYKRPFDPTLVIADNGDIRMYFSSSKTGTLMALDSTVHSYSAISSDGINFTFEPGVRVGVADSITIDPAVVKLGSVWHYTCPRAAPQHGAHHFISNDGLAWTRTTSVISDNNHNWTGNLMLDGSNIKFYGTPNPWINSIWSKQSSDVYSWSPYINCNGPITVSTIQADPAVLKIAGANYLMVYVSKQSILGGSEPDIENTKIKFWPNPARNFINVHFDGLNNKEDLIVELLNTNGVVVYKDKVIIKEGTLKIKTEEFAAGLYMMKVKTVGKIYSSKIIIEK